MNYIRPENIDSADFVNLQIIHCICHCWAFRCRDIQRAAEKKAREDQFRAELNAKQKIKNDFSSQYGHLGVSNDDEIDAKLRELEFRQQHESLTINEEKAIIKQIKQLQVGIPLRLG